MLGITLNAAVSDAKIFTRCQLARELNFNGIPKTFISNCKQLALRHDARLTPMLFQGFVWSSRSPERTRRKSRSSPISVRVMESFKSTPRSGAAREDAAASAEFDVKVTTA